MVVIICEIVLTLCGLGLLICFIGLIGTSINCMIDIKLIEAIGAHQRNCIRDNNWREFFSVDTGDIYNFNMIQDCFPWLWRYKKHLPPEKYEIIKPYLKTPKSVGGVGGFDFYHGVYRNHEKEE